MSAEGVAEVLQVVARLIWYSGLLVVIGASAFRLFVAPAAARLAPDAGRVAAGMGLIGAVVLLVGVFSRLYAQTYAWFGIDEPITWRLLLDVAAGIPPWSTGWMAQAAAGLTAAAALAAARRGGPAAWTVALLSSLAVAATMPLTGHAVAQPIGSVVPVTLQAIHVLAAGIWLGGLLVLIVVVVRVAAAEPPLAAALVRRFSSLALTAASLLVATGIATAFLYLGEPRDLWSTAYGGTLLVKVSAFAGVAVMGFFNWRHVRPQLGHGGGVALLRRTATIELVLAALVLALTARLAGLPH